MFKNGSSLPSVGFQVEALVRRPRRKPSPEWSAVGDFVDQSLKKLGVRRSIQRVTLEEWCRGWLGESGSKFLARTTVKDGVVTLEMKHPAWLQELASRKQELLKKVQERFPELAIREAKVLLAKAGTTSKDEG